MSLPSDSPVLLPCFLLVRLFFHSLLPAGSGEQFSLVVSHSHPLLRHARYSSFILRPPRTLLFPESWVFLSPGVYEEMEKQRDYRHFGGTDSDRPQHGRAIAVRSHSSTARWNGRIACTLSNERPRITYVTPLQVPIACRHAPPACCTSRGSHTHAPTLGGTPFTPPPAKHCLPPRVSLLLHLHGGPCPRRPPLPRGTPHIYTHPHPADNRFRRHANPTCCISGRGHAMPHLHRQHPRPPTPLQAIVTVFRI